MTGEDAITIFKRQKKLCLHKNDWFHALEMAIEALEQMEVIEAIINSPIYIQEDVLRYKMICEVVKKMTDEQRKQFIEEQIEIFPADCEMGEFLRDMAKLQPCEDAISRKQALDAFGLSEKTRKYGGDHSGYNTMMLYEIQDVIEGLPSVSTEKIGRWNKKYDSIVNDYFWECDICKCGFQRDYPYCPNCGAKMETQESEE